MSAALLATLDEVIAQSTRLTPAQLTEMRDSFCVLPEGVNAEVIDLVADDGDLATSMEDEDLQHCFSMAGGHRVLSWIRRSSCDGDYRILYGGPADERSLWRIHQRRELEACGEEPEFAQDIYFEGPRGQEAQRFCVDVTGDITAFEGVRGHERKIACWSANGAFSLYKWSNGQMLVAALVEPSGDVRLYNEETILTQRVFMSGSMKGQRWKRGERGQGIDIYWEVERPDGEVWTFYGTRFFELHRNEVLTKKILADGSLELLD